MEAVRAALALELRDFARSRAATKNPSDAQLKRLEKNYEDAWREFERQRDAGMDHALRALAGVREALTQLRYATSQDDDLIEIAFYAYDDESESARWRVPRERAFRSIPERYRNGDYRIAAQLHFGSGSDVRIYNRKGKLVWSAHGKPIKRPQPRRALPLEDPPPARNGGPH